MSGHEHAIVGTTRTYLDNGEIMLHDECQCGERIDSRGATEVAAMRQATIAWLAHSGR